MSSSLRPGFQAHQDDKQTAELHARISQETFDQAVQENIDDFEMTPEEALADAITQFEAQGINLNNVVRRVPGAGAEDEPPVLQHVRALQSLVEDLEDDETLDIQFGGGMMRISFRVCGAEAAIQLSEASASVRAELQRERGADQKTSCVLAGHNGGVDALISAMLATWRVPSALPPSLEALALLLMDAECREQLGVRGVAVICAVIRNHAVGTPAVLRAALHAARAAMLIHEHHRQLFVDKGGLLELTLAAMRGHADDGATFLAACGALRATTLADDARARACKGLEHAKAAVEGGALPMLLAALRSPMRTQASVLAELLATLSRLTVTDEICSRLARMDALPLAITELGNHVTDAAVAKQACFFLANISGNDQCKASIVSGQGHVLIVQAMHLHQHNAGMQTDAVAALGNMALRMPKNSEAIAKAGGLSAIVSALTAHVAYPRMQSKGCLAVRNLVGRNEENIAPFLEQGIEQPLRAVMSANLDGPVHNQAKAALRDMHCSVSLQENFKGEIGSAFILPQGEEHCENHWDKFIETPVAQEAIRKEMDALGIQSE